MVNKTVEGWTFGAEHELGDWVLRNNEYNTDRRDVTMVNSTGIAVDPKRNLYQFGGEINTEPTGTIQGQVNILEQIKEMRPKATVNYRSNLHVHVRVPGLKDDLQALKQVQEYVHREFPKVIDRLVPLEKPLPHEYATEQEWEGAKRRYRRRKVSHRALLTKQRLQHQLEAEDVEEFFRREVPQDKHGNALWACQPRLAVNLRQLRETDTVEFRHFPGTLIGRELFASLLWAQYFLQAALKNESAEALYNDIFRGVAFPTFPKYVHWMEIRYRATCHDGTNTKEQILKNIQAIHEGKFDGRDLAGEPIAKRTRAVSRKHAPQPVVRSSAKKGTRRKPG